VSQRDDGLAGNRGAHLAMYNPPHFSISDIGWMHEFIVHNPFATIATVIDGAVHFAYAPLVFDRTPAPLGTVYFHLARSNPIASLANGAVVKVGLMGPHAYISPDWYDTPNQVPTWNYTAVEGSGCVQRLDETESLEYLTRLSVEQESYLAPKAPWSPDRLQPGTLKQMLLGIVWFRLPFDTLEGKAKLSQNRSQTDIGNVIAALRECGDEAGAAVAAAMQILSVR
jgi:transcriptional regulator